MKALIINTDYSLSEECDEGVIIFEINNNRYEALTLHNRFKEGQLVEVTFDGLSTGKQPIWDYRFRHNPNRLKKMINLGSNLYDGYGIIIQINPIIADFGDIQLDIGNWSNDERLIGESIYWPEIHLNISK
jgi:hypothetical protein